MSDVLSFNPNRALTANIDAAAAARAFFYDAGTTTLRTVYADSALTTPHASPLVANAAGIFPAVYVDGAAVKVVAQDAAGATLYTLDPCVKVSAAGATAVQVSFAPSTAAPYTNVQDAIDDLAGFRNGGDSNRVINGDFGVWQRTTSITGDGFAADRWYNKGIGGTVSQTRATITPGGMIGSNSPAFALTQTVSGQTLSSHFAQTTHKIESALSYAGETITVLGYAARVSGAGNMAVGFNQISSTGTTLNNPATTITLSSSYQAFAVVMNVPSVTGFTINGTDYLELLFWTSAGSDFNASTNSLGLQTIGVRLWGIHIKRGVHPVSAASVYSPRIIGEEMRLCQRFYEVGDVGSDGGIGTKYALAGGNAYNATHMFKVDKRAAPTIAFTGTTTFDNCSALQAVNVAAPTRGFTSRVTVSPTGSYRAYGGGWTADAEFI